MGSCRCLFLDTSLQFIKYSLELLSGLLIFLHLGLVDYVNVPLDANEEPLGLIFFIMRDPREVKEATGDLVLLEFGVGAAKGTSVEYSLSDSKFLGLVYQLAIGEDRLLLMGFHEKLKDVLEHLGYGIFGDTHLVAQFTERFCKHLLNFWPQVLCFKLRSQGLVIIEL